MTDGDPSFNPANLLAGPSADPVSPAESLKLSLQRTALESALTGLSHWSGQVKLYSRATLAAMAMAGIHLRALRVIYFGERNPNGGRPRSSKTLCVTEFPDWGTMLAKVAGISDLTARRWMKIADVVEAMALAQGCDIISICQKLPWEWTPEESERLGKTVHQLTQDKTQRDLLQSNFLPSLGYVEPARMNGSNNQLGVNGGRKMPAASPQEKAEGVRLLARTALFGHDSPEHRPKPGSPAFWMNSIIEAGFKGELAKHPLASLPAHEIQDLHDHLFKPLLDQVKSLLDS